MNFPLVASFLIILVKTLNYFLSKRRVGSRIKVFRVFYLYDFSYSTGEYTRQNFPSVFYFFHFIKLGKFKDFRAFIKYAECCIYS